MEVDKYGNHWYGTVASGLFKYNPKTNKTLNLTKENSLLKNNSIYQIRNVYSGNLWVSSGERVYNLDVNKDIITSVFSKSSGITGGGYGLYANLQDSIVAINHYPFILLAKVAKNNTININQQKIFVTSIKVNDSLIILRPIEKDTSITLKYNQNNICIEFTNLSLLNSNSNYYRYKIKDVDKDWNLLTENRLCLQRLQAGAYNLVIQGSNNSGVWQEDVFNMKINITPIFYKSFWFLSLIGLLVVIGLYKLYRWRIYQIREEEYLKTFYKKQLSELEMKALRAQMNPHFIFNSLNSIQKFIFDRDEYSASQYLTKFSRLIRLILDHSDQDFISIASEKELLRLYLEMESLRFTEVFDYNINIDDTISLDYKIPSMIIQPHVENAIWHGLLHLPKEKESPNYRKGKLLINLNKSNNNEILITIEDNGVGREKAKEYKSKQVLKKKSYGSNLSEQRIRIFNEMHGVKTDFKIEDLLNVSNESIGTRVTIKLAYIS
jgi:sensor histidine kinase YesM